MKKLKRGNNLEITSDIGQLITAQKQYLFKFVRRRVYVPVIAR